MYIFNQLNIFVLLFGIPGDVTSLGVNKRTESDGVILPIGFADHALQVTFGNMYQNIANPPFGKDMHMRITSRCSYSRYFYTEGSGTPHSGIFIRFNVTSLEGNNRVSFNGALKKAEPPRHLSTINGQLCIKSLSNTQDPFKNLMDKFGTKVVSFWFSGTYATSTNSPSAVIGEMGIGNPNLKRISPGNQVKITLVSLRDPRMVPHIWQSRDMIELKINQDVPEMNGRCFMTFDYGSHPFGLPANVFDTIVDGLRRADMPATPASPAISADQQHHDSPIKSFVCQDAENLPDLHFGSLIVNKRQLYVVRDEVCILKIYPAAPMPGGLCQYLFGSLILRSFHVTVDYDQEFIQFSKQFQEGVSSSDES